MNSENKIVAYDIVVIIASIGMIGGILTLFYGVPFIQLIGYFLVLLPFILFTYICLLIDFIIHFGRKPFSHYTISSHSIIGLTIISLLLYHSELFKANRLITATLFDDFSKETLILRENDEFEKNTSSIFFHYREHSGKFEIKQDTLIILDPDDNNYFLPETMLIVPEDSAIFIDRNPDGTFRTEKEWLNHYKIE